NRGGMFFALAVDGFGFIQYRMKWRFTAMTTDERDILEILKDELDFIEKGGYGRSVRTPWQSKSTFQDSLTCVNYGYPYRAHPCNECHLIDFVGKVDRATDIPCHHIPLNAQGDTIADLEASENQHKMEEEVKEWLRTRIKEIEDQNKHAPMSTEKSTPGSSESNFCCQS